MPETTAAQERPSLWLLEVGLSPEPRAMGLGSNEQGHCHRTGPAAVGSPGPQKGRLGTWGRSRSSLAPGGRDANKLFFNEAAVCPSVHSGPSSVNPQPVPGMHMAFLVPLVLRSMVGRSDGTSSAALEIGPA